MAEPLLQVSGARAAYGASQVLFGIDLAVGAGEVVGLLGRNGMGKTTLIRSIVGLKPMAGGEVRFRGEAISGLSAGRCGP